MKHAAIFGAGLFIAAACASAPDYRSASSVSGEGFSEQVIEADRYRVTYKLDEDHIGKAQDYALLRAAELTMEKGFETFEVVYETAETQEAEPAEISTGFGEDYVISRDCGLLSCRTAAYPMRSSSEFGTFADEGETVVNLEIRLSNDDASSHPRKYDASQVAASIRARLG